MEFLRVRLNQPGLLSHLSGLKQLYQKRDWIDHHIISWFDRNHRFLLLEAYPGAGKSCYCSHFFHYNPMTASLIFCDEVFYEKDKIVGILKRIAYSLATKYPEYRSNLLWTLNTLNGDINALSHKALMDLLIVRPLQFNIDGGQPFALIVLDGIDLLEGEERTILVDGLLNQSSVLPDYIGFLFTARQSISINGLFASNEILTIQPDGVNTKDDIVKYLRKAIPCLPDKDYGNLSNRCHGSFLFAHLLARFINDGGVDIETIHPGEIYRLYHASMKRIISDTATFSKWAKSLSLMSQFDHIPVSIFKEVLKWGEQDYSDFRKLFLSLTEITNDSFGEKVISFVYPSFGTWLCQQNHEYHITPREGIELMKSLFWDSRINNLHQYLLLHIEDIFCNDQEALSMVSQNEMIFTRILQEGERCLADSRHFFEAESFFLVCESLARTSGNNKLLKVLLPFYRAKKAFFAGEFQTCAELLIPYYNLLESNQNRLDALYMLGTSCDILGNRKDATSFFLELLAVSENNPDYLDLYIKALCGLLWLDHFNNLSEAQKHLEKLHRLDNLSPLENILRNLIMARHLLSIGELKNALNLFDSVVLDNAADMWGYDSVSCRNQMLLIEALVACFDNNLYDKGIAMGKEILSHLEGHGSIAECYCSSWIALNCIGDGLIEDAVYYLTKSKEMNLYGGNEVSVWMAMHLTSTQAFIETEKEDYEKAIELHQKVLSSAKLCNDAWVAGDALFEMFFLLFNSSERIDSRLHEIAAELKKLAQDSDLPHLVYKADLVNAFLYGDKIDDVIILTLNKVAKGTLPSVDEVRSLHMCLQLPSSNKFRNELETSMRETINNITCNNPRGKYLERPYIKNILKQISHEC